MEGRKGGGLWSIREQMGASGSQGQGREQMKAQRTKGSQDIWRAYEKGTPPPFAERQVPSTLIIFRNKNTEKSHLGLIGKNFGKNLWENVSGKEKAPNLVERGRGVLKYERLVQR